MRNVLFFIILVFAINTLQAQIDSTKLFETCRGKLPLPVKHFTKVIDNSKSTSNSDHNLATIFTSDVRDSVFSICDGKVVSILHFDGAAYGILINIGAYYLVYTSIKPTSLKKGDVINQHHFIGFMSKDLSVDYYLSIQLLKNKNKEIPIYNWFKWE